MSNGTRGRGARDTAEAALRTPLRAASRRALPLSLLVATLLHVPFVPTALFDWLGLLTSMGSVEFTDYDAGETVIPIELDPLAGEPSAAEQAPPTAPAPPPDQRTAPPPPAPPPASPARGAPADAGVKASRDAGSDAGAEEPRSETGPPKLRDPLSVAGAPAKLATRDPNVQVLISGDRLRKHELGDWFSRVLTTIPEWQSFFEGTSIDPIRDFDHLLLAGPQFRDSKHVVAVMDYRVPEATIRGAIDVVVARSGGAWIEEAPVPAARGKADRSERIFAMLPQKRMLVVLPGDAEGELAKLKAVKSFNRSTRAGIVISMLTPANAFRGLHEVPKTLKWLRLALTPTSDGGADLALSAGDASAAEARVHARELTKSLNALRKLDMGFTSIDILDEVEVEAEGDVLWTRVHVTTRQLRLVLGFAEQMLKDQQELRRSRK